MNRSSQRIGSNSTKREATATASFRNRKSLLRRRKSSRRRKENNRKLSETSSQYNNNCKDDNANEEGEDSDSMQDEDASKSKDAICNDTPSFICNFKTFKDLSCTFNLVWLEISCSYENLSSESRAVRVKILTVKFSEK